MTLDERVSRVSSALERIRYPVEVAVSARDGRLAVVTTPSHREQGHSFESRIWMIDDGGAPSQITDGPGSDSTPRFSPVDDRFVFASDRARPGKMEIYIAAAPGEPAARVGDVHGTIEDIRWTSDGNSLIVQAADPEADAAAAFGATPLWWDAPRDPIPTDPQRGWRRLLRVDLADGRTTEIGPSGLTIWAFDMVGDERAVAIVSADPSERGYYHAHLVSISFADRGADELYRPSWQIQSPAVSPDGTQVALVEGWSSDRWLVCGEVRIVGIDTGTVESMEHLVDDVTSVAWRDDSSLWVAGWAALGSHYGLVDTTGARVWRVEEDAVIGPNSFFAHVSPTADGRSLVGVREMSGTPPEVVTRSADGGASEWTPLTAFNADVVAGITYPEIKEIDWHGRDGLALRGLLMLPLDAGPGPHPTIVNVHGGPTWAWRHSFDPGNSIEFAAAGYAVFLPNYRGNAGWGQEFARMNIGDPGGAEWDDILLGIDACVAEGDVGGDRLGITGGSYGGYMTGWAATTSNRFKAAVMVSGISNLISAHFTSNHSFYEFIIGESPYDRKALDLYVDRSPITHAAKASTPTLIVHGTEDRCTPVGQAEELFVALAENGVEVERVLYPREGHGNQEREHRQDASRRTLEWFDRFLRSDERVP